MQVAPFLQGLNSFVQKAIFLSQNSPVKPAGQVQEYEFKPSTQVAPFWHLWLPQSSTLTSHRPPSKPDGQWHLGNEKYIWLIFWDLDIIQSTIVILINYQNLIELLLLQLTHICQSRTPCRCRRCYKGFHNKHQFCTDTLSRGSRPNTDTHNQGRGWTCTLLHSGMVVCSKGHTWPAHHLVLALDGRQQWVYSFLGEADCFLEKVKLHKSF